MKEKQKKTQNFTTQATRTKGIGGYKYTTNLNDPPSK